jgi:hypothetical protein
MAVACLALACASRRELGSPPSAPAIDEPALAIPADLDLVVRLDLARLRSLLGGELRASIEGVLRRTTSHEPDAETARLLLSAFSRAETAWIGVRPGLSPELTDSAVVLRGKFSGLVPREIGGSPRFSRAQDLGGGVFRFQRQAPRERAAPAVLYVREPDLLIVGSVAEIDALERTLVQKHFDTTLRAPETGLISAAARLGLLQRRLAERAPTFAELVQGAERLEFSVDRVSEQFVIQAEMAFDAADRAAVVADAMKALIRLLGRGPRAWLSNTQVQGLGRFVSLRLSLSPQEILKLLGCAREGGC